MLKNVYVKRDALLKKHPGYKYFSIENKKDLINKTILSSNKLKDSFYQNGINLENQPLMRLKSGTLEPGAYLYLNPFDAFEAAMAFACDTDFECSGYVTSDGTAILYISPNGSHSSAQYCPDINTNGNVSTYDGRTISATFHTHFNGSGYSTPENTSSSTGNNDLTTQQNYFNCSDIIILYQNDIYVYGTTTGWRP